MVLPLSSSTSPPATEPWAARAAHGHRALRAQWRGGHDAGVYDDPLYQRNRRIALARRPLCPGWPRGRHRGAPIRATTADHRVPIVEGGTHELANIEALCGPCNSRKGADEARRRRPAAPRRGSRAGVPGRVWREA